MSETCPTCCTDWAHWPPAKIDGQNSYRCIVCKAVYSGEMRAAPDIKAALKEVVSDVEGICTSAAVISPATFALVRAAISKAESASLSSPDKTEE